MDTLTYLLHVNGYWILFFVCYQLLLRKNTFFKLNRGYLILALVVSFLLPLIHFEEVINSIAVAQSPQPITMEAGINTDVPKISNLFITLLLFYFLGVLYMAYRFLRGLFKFWKLVGIGEHIPCQYGTLVLISENGIKKHRIGSFSFFSWIVVTQYDYENHFDGVLQHETTHVRQLHSLDIMLIEVLKIVFWFNPILWFYKTALQEIHEYLADEITTDRQHYALHLVSYSKSLKINRLSNQFSNHSLLKQRIEMLYKKKDSKWHIYRYLLIALMVSISVNLTAERKRVILKQQVVRPIGEPINNSDIQQTSNFTSPIDLIQENKKSAKIGKPSPKQLVTKSAITLPDTLGNLDSTKTFMNYGSAYRYKIHSVVKIEDINMQIPKTADGISINSSKPQKLKTPTLSLKFFKPNLPTEEVDETKP